MFDLIEEMYQYLSNFRYMAWIQILIRTQFQKIDSDLYSTLYQISGENLVTQDIQQQRVPNVRFYGLLTVYNPTRQNQSGF